VFADGSTTRPPGSTEIRQVDYLEGLKVGYKWYDAERIEPLFPFGHGLSYTKFDYGRVDVGPRIVRAGRSIHVSFRVKNTGSRTGTEVAQVYLDLPSYTRTPVRLAGYERVTLAPGKSRTVHIEIDPDTPDHPMSYWSGRWRLPAGFFKVSVGRSASDIEEGEVVLVYR
jgi:beta-glucosidase